ncbi:hypothetical protein TNCV_3176051 [Trichonephila clavipes]|nr:hypothetical protein TNCV_3176051 [Trichonephila clavipes]
MPVVGRSLELYIGDSTIYPFSTPILRRVWPGRKGIKSTFAVLEPFSFKPNSFLSDRLHLTSTIEPVAAVSGRMSGVDQDITFSRSIVDPKRKKRRKSLRPSISWSSVQNVLALPSLEATTTSWGLVICCLAACIHWSRSGMNFCVDDNAGWHLGIRISVEH